MLFGFKRGIGLKTVYGLRKVLGFLVEACLGFGWDWV